MAGDWIKMRTDLYRDPKVSVMADVLMDENGDLASYVDQNCQRNMTVTRNVTRNACVGALLSVWGVMRHRGVRIEDDLVCMGVGLWVLDDIADMPGFGNAMESTGWAKENDQGLIFPRFFDEYNVEPDGKNKSKNAERQARYRERKRLAFTPENNVTSNVTHNVTVAPRIEESRVEKSIEYLSLSTLGIKHFEFLSQNTKCPNWLAPEFCRWLAFRAARDSRPVDEILQDAWVGDLIARGPERALVDIAFSIRKQAKNLIHAEDDFDKIAKSKIEKASKPSGKESAADAMKRIFGEPE